MKKILILIFLASIPILYLCAHNRSFRMTRQITDLEEEKKLLGEQLEQLRIEAAKAYSYSTIETKAIALGLTFTPTDSSNRLSENLTSMANKALSKKK
ncbi:MAG: hypothetical protein ACETVX_01145 [bacterium]